jgi:hypothetical protein
MIASTLAASENASRSGWPARVLSPLMLYVSHAGVPMTRRTAGRAVIG